MFFTIYYIYINVILHIYNLFKDKQILQAVVIKVHVCYNVLK